MAVLCCVFYYKSCCALLSSPCESSPPHHYEPDISHRTLQTHKLVTCAWVLLRLTHSSFMYLEHDKYRLDNEANGSTRNRNPRSHTIEPKCKACGFYMAMRISMERRSRWPSRLTDLEYSNRCYAAEVFCLQAFACLTLACFVEQSKERQQTWL